ncbi:MAG TPA: Do family serine endopeptidase [Nevskiaceae bacterium]|nr:Do family serine endopeptidase [Nevskiaceae bacterium]
MGGAPSSRRALWLVPLAVVLLLAGCGRSTAMPDFSALVKRVSPAVVNITATTVADPSVATNDSLSQAPDWARKYLDPAAPASVGDDGDEEPTVSTGSGFVLWSNGYILTNEHVIDGSNEVTVRLSDGRQLLAQVVGADQPSDIALLKVDAKDLPTVRIANDKKLEVGQWVVAIGSPFGFDYSVTAGIVSAIGRDLSSEQYVPFIQTDAAINPGNSGGPLFNMDGQVVGINSQIYSQTGGFMGVAFAAPINVAVKVARELKATGHVRRGWMGVVVQEVTRKLALSFGLRVPHGALVTRVIPGGPAQQAGLRAGDVILSYNGERLNSSRGLPPLVGNSDPGEVVKLGVLRDHQRVTVGVQLAELKSAKTSPRGEAAPNPSARALAAAPDFGLTLGVASAAQLSKAGLANGLDVLDVAAGPARDAGLQVGDIVIAVQGVHLRSVAQFRALAKRLTPGSNVPVLVQRGNGPMFIALQVPAR